MNETQFNWTWSIVALSEVMLLSLFTADAAFAQSADSPAAHTMPEPAESPNLSPADAARLHAEASAMSTQMRKLEQRMRTSLPTKVQEGGGCKGCDSAQSAPMDSKKSSMSMAGMMDERGAASQSANNAAPKPVESGAMAMEQMMGMGAMSGMKSAAVPATPASLPGFPGQSHVYHLGAPDFFLDHSQHITLTPEQQQVLTQYKQRSLLQQSELQRQIDGAEEGLWQLTGADQPDIGTIDNQVHQIERLRAEQRINFIRAVGEAAKVLTDQQREQLTGMAPAQAAQRKSMSAPSHGQAKTDKMSEM